MNYTIILIYLCFQWTLKSFAAESTDAAAVNLSPDSFIPSQSDLDSSTQLSNDEVALVQSGSGSTTTDNFQPPSLYSGSADNSIKISRLHNPCPAGQRHLCCEIISIDYPHEHCRSHESIEDGSQECNPSPYGNDAWFCCLRMTDTGSGVGCAQINRYMPVFKKRPTGSRKRPNGNHGVGLPGAGSEIPAVKPIEVFPPWLSDGCSKRGERNASLRSAPPSFFGRTFMNQTIYSLNKTYPPTCPPNPSTPSSPSIISTLYSPPSPFGLLSWMDTAEWILLVMVNGILLVMLDGFYWCWCLADHSQWLLSWILFCWSCSNSMYLLPSSLYISIHHVHFQFVEILICHDQIQCLTSLVMLRFRPFIHHLTCLDSACLFCLPSCPYCVWWERIINLEMIFNTPHQ